MRAYPSLENYIKAPHERIIESLSENDLFIERVMLGLRCAKGVDLQVFEAHKDAVKLKELIGILCESGKCDSTETHLVANELFLCDEITSWLLARVDSIESQSCLRINT